LQTKNILELKYYRMSNMAMLELLLV
jgi:hypothetical protein